MVGKITVASILITIELIPDSFYLHTADAIRTSYLVIIRNVDTDVLVIGIHHFYQITKDWRDKNIVMHVGMGAHKRIF